jgi:hypothetical protein
MDIPVITDGTRLPTQALRVSMALAIAVAAADDSVKTPPIPPGVSLMYTLPDPLDHCCA